MQNTSEVIIIPGWLHGKREWAGAGSYLPSHNITVLELPGFGDTPLVSNMWGVPEYAEWVLAHIKDRHEPFVLVGHSLGGRIASYLAGTHRLPQTCSGLVLYAAPSLYRPSCMVRAKSGLAHFLRVSGLAHFVPMSLKPSDTQDADARNLGQMFRRIVTFDQTTILPSVTVPTVLLWGEHDTSVPLRIAHEMQKLIPHSTLRIIDNVGHNAHLENKSLFYATLEDVLKNK